MKRPAMWKVVTVGIALGFGVIGAGAAMAKPSDVLRVSAEGPWPPDVVRDSTDNAGPPEILGERAVMLPGTGILSGLPGL